MYALITWQSKGDLEHYARERICPDLKSAHLLGYIEDLNVVRRVQQISELTIYTGRICIKGEGLWAQLVDSYKSHFHLFFLDDSMESNQSLCLQLISIYRIFEALYKGYRNKTIRENLGLSRYDLHQFFGRYLTLFAQYEIGFLKLAGKVVSLIEQADGLSRVPASYVEEFLHRRKASLSKKQSLETLLKNQWSTAEEDSKNRYFFDAEFLMEHLALSMAPTSVPKALAVSYVNKLKFGFKALFDRVEPEDVSGKNRRAEGSGEQKIPDDLVGPLVEQLSAARHCVECDDFLLALYHYCATAGSNGGDVRYNTYRIMREMKGVLSLLSCYSQVDELKRDLSLHVWLEKSGAFHKMRLESLRGATGIPELEGYQVGNPEEIVLEGGISVWKADAFHTTKQTSCCLVSSSKSQFHLYTEVLQELGRKDFLGSNFRYGELARFGQFYITGHIQPLQGTETDAIVDFILDCIMEGAMPRHVDHRIWGVVTGQSQLSSLIPTGSVSADRIEIERYCLYLVHDRAKEYRAVIQAVARKYSGPKDEVKTKILKMLTCETFQAQHFKDYSPTVRRLAQETYIALATIGFDICGDRKMVIKWYKESFEGTYIPGYISNAQPVWQGLTEQLKI